MTSTYRFTCLMLTILFVFNSMAASAYAAFNADDTSTETRELEKVSKLMDKVSARFESLSPKKKLRVLKRTEKRLTKLHQKIKKSQTLKVSFGPEEVYEANEANEEALVSESELKALATNKRLNSLSVEKVLQDLEETIRIVQAEKQSLMDSLAGISRLDRKIASSSCAGLTVIGAILIAGGIGLCFVPGAIVIGVLVALLFGIPALTMSLDSSCYRY